MEKDCKDMPTLPSNFRIIIPNLNLTKLLIIFYSGSILHL